MLRSIRRIAFLLGGLFLTAIGLFTVSLCEEDRVPYGALAGAVGGLLFALVKRKRSAQPFTTPGALLGGLVVALRQVGCAEEPIEYLIPLVLAVAVGVGIGLIHDSFRAPDAPPRGGPTT
jgi:hypothetical protein